MSVSKPAGCLFKRPMMTKSRALSCRHFHVCSILPERRRPRFASVKATDMGLISKSASESIRPYDKKEKAALAKRYTPEQLQVIEEGEAAIDPEDIRTQGMFRSDPYRLPYLDDLSTIRPVVDHRFPEQRVLPDNARIMNTDEASIEMEKWMSKASQYLEEKIATETTTEGTTQGETQSEKLSKAVNDPKVLKFARSEFLKYLTSAPGATGNTVGRSSLVPGLPKISDMKGQYQTTEQMDPRDPEGKFTRLMKQTGLTLDDILDAKVKILVRNSVTNQTRLGKIQSMYCLAVAGDGNGRLGLGEGKAIEADEAMDKARQAAIRNMKPIPRYEDRTIFGEVEGKVAACEVKLMARPPGFGLRCQHNIFEMARAAGIEDLAARVPRGRNPMNTIKATYEALMSQRLPDEIARGRGKKLVDVRKVYYGGDQRFPQRQQQDEQRRS